ncbi:MAG: hypothetical protein ACI94Y_003995 [Maribacter sp.]|jgi:hypothetical protein
MDLNLTQTLENLLNPLGNQLPSGLTHKLRDVKLP